MPYRAYCQRLMGRKLIYDTDSLNLEKGQLGDRLRIARRLLGISQKQGAELADCGLRSWQDYEANKKTPGSSVIAKLALHGVNANWLLTGEGEALQSREKGPAKLDLNFLCAILQAMEISLRQNPKEMSALDKARIITLIYDLFMGSELVSDSEKLLTLINAIGQERRELENSP